MRRGGEDQFEKGDGRRVLAEHLGKIEHILARLAEAMRRADRINVERFAAKLDTGRQGLKGGATGRRRST